MVDVTPPVDISSLDSAVGLMTDVDIPEDFLGQSSEESEEPTKSEY